MSIHCSQEAKRDSDLFLTSLIKGGAKGDEIGADEIVDLEDSEAIGTDERSGAPETNGRKTLRGNAQELISKVRLLISEDTHMMHVDSESLHVSTHILCSFGVLWTTTGREVRNQKSEG